MTVLFFVAAGLLVAATLASAIASKPKTTGEAIGVFIGSSLNVFIIVLLIFAGLTL